MSSDDKLSLKEKLELIVSIEYWQRDRWNRLKSFHAISHIPIQTRHLFMKNVIELIRSQKARHENLKNKIISLDFSPLFFILDKKCRWVMAVRKEDAHYAYKGISPEQVKYYEQADYIFDKYFHVDDALRDEALAGDRDEESMFSADQVQDMLIDFTIAYCKSPNKDISNDAAEYVYDKLLKQNEH